MRKIIISVGIIIFIIIIAIGINLIKNNRVLNEILTDYVSQYTYSIRDRYIYLREVGIYLIDNTIKANDISEFDIDEYNYYIQNFSAVEILKGERILGTIDNPEDAKTQAELIWTELYGKEDTEEDKPYKVDYDKNSKVWHVRGTLPPNYIGGVMHILITQDEGIILAVWKEK